MAATTKMRPLLAWVACLTAVCFYADAKPKYVNTILNAKWASTPLLMETSEFIAKESNDIFWSYVNDIADLDPASIGNVIDNEEAMYHLGLKVAGRYLTPLRVNLLKFALSLRSHSPAVEMFSMMANGKNPPQECESFIEIHDLITCETAAAKAFIKLASGPGTMLIKTDHHYPRSSDNDVTVVLYGRLGEPSCSRKHKELRALAEAGKIHYVFRHYMKVPSKTKTRLSGYGVELAIKNQEYKAKDDTKVEVNEEENKEDAEEEVQGFMFSQLKTLHPELAEDLKTFRTHLEESDNEMTPLKVWQLQDLSFQAAQRIMAAPPNEALKVMRDISQNFPVRARSLAATVVKENMRTEITKNQRVFESTLNIGQGEAALLINGMQVDMEVYDVFSLLDMLKADGKLMEGLHALDIKDKTLSGLLKVDLSDSDTNYAVDFRDPAVVYVNNIEKDRKYSGWPSSMQEMLRPTFPGMLRHVRKNFFHLVYFIDPSDSKQREVVKMAEAFYVHSAPIRIGLVFVVNPDPEADATTDAGVAMLRAFSYINKLHSPTKGLSFITDVYERVGDGDISADLVMQEFSSMYPSASTGDVFGINSQYDKWRTQCNEFFVKTGLGKAPQVLINGVPLRREEIQPDGIEEAVVSGILRNTPELQKDIYNGKLYDGMDILDYLMSQPNVMPRLNSRILSPSEQYLDFTKETDASLVRQPEKFEQLPGVEMTAAMLNNMHYLSKKDDEVVRAVTVWVVADLETPEGRTMAYNAVKHMKHTNGLRLGIVHNSVTLPTSVDTNSHFISKAVYVAIKTLVPSMARSFVTKLLKEENVAALADGTKTLDDLEVNKMDMAAYKESLAKENLSFLLSHRMFCNSVLSFRAGQRGVVTNGKVLGPLQDTESFLTEDFSLLEKYTQKTYADKIKSLINDMGLDYDKASDLVMRVSSLLNSVSRSEARRDIEYHTDRHSVINLPGKSDEPAYDIVAIIDPATRAAQKYAPILMVLQQVVNCNIRIFMNCKEKLSEAPLKSFYRFVLDPEVTFNIRSEYVTGPMGRFANVAQKPLLTLAMDLPESWLVEVVRSPYDLDNIYLEEVNSGVNAEFELEYLLLEGHCYDTSSGQPPRGLQFILGTTAAPAMVDTIVMANLGYFQLKANPGAWNLQLRPGRSFEIYDITSHEYTDSPPDSPEVLVVLDSFKSKIIKLRVNKKSGKEKEDLLGGENEAGSGIWDSISSVVKDTIGVPLPDAAYLRSFTGRTGTGDNKQETLNIFSVASGHLYERFLRIMMTSVLKNTQSRVKFWFLKNFLSPTFKDFIPHMAKKYDFDYELVQYKWPRWLHQQREKQRIIWGYKILFLDVLFPLDVDKIIFVDADQIVRTDLKELHDFDLEGAPYGYTPFCDSKREMDGFRFWKSGYWASHLAGRKYHISALYVVDLKKFRKVAAGDRLRGQYQGLSQDPNSLSNLDQDLPNNMIHQVSIKSLPQEWLWCETWCGKDEKQYAKTIDLCNNPLTKEPKLEAAMRIVPEWKEYDAEIKTLWDEVQRAGKFIDEESIEAPAQQGSTTGRTEL